MKYSYCFEDSTVSQINQEGSQLVTHEPTFNITVGEYHRVDLVGLVGWSVECISMKVSLKSEVQIDGRPRRLSFFPGDKVVHFTGPYGRPSLSVKSLKIND